MPRAVIEIHLEHGGWADQLRQLTSWVSQRLHTGPRFSARDVKNVWKTYFRQNKWRLPKSDTLADYSIVVLLPPPSTAVSAVTCCHRAIVAALLSVALLHLRKLAGVSHAPHLQQHHDLGGRGWVQPGKRCLG